MTSSPSRCGEPILYKLGAGPTANATAVHRLYQEVWSSLVASTHGAEIFDRDGVLITSAGGKWPVMNTAFLSTPVATEADLQNRISIARKYFAQKRSFWLFILFNNWLDYSIQSEHVFSTGGLLHMESCIGMQTNNSIKPKASPSELRFRLVE